MPLLDLEPLVRDLPKDVHRTEIAHGVKGTASTIETMIRLAKNAKRNMELRVLIGQIVAPCAQKDYYCYAKAIHDYVCHTIKYAYDPVDIELVEDPMNIVRAGIADCDSKCILFAAMCEQIGLPCRFVTLKSSFLADEYTHVFAQVNIKGKWVTSDCTMPKEEFGWDPPKDMPRKYWPVSESAAAAGEEQSPGDFFMGGLGAMNCCGTSGMACGGCMMAELGLAPQKKRRGLRGLKGLGATSGEVVNIIQQTMDGTMADQLQSEKIRAQENMTYVYGLLVDAQNSGDSDLASQLSQKYQDTLDATHAVQDAINQYSELVNAIQTYSAGYVTPRQLAEVATTAIALAGIAAVAVIAVALSQSYIAAQRANSIGARAARDSQIAASMAKAGATPEQIQGSLDSEHASDATYDNSSAGGGGSSITSSIGTTVLVVGVAALLFMGLKKKGIV